MYLRYFKDIMYPNHTDLFLRIKYGNDLISDNLQMIQEVQHDEAVNEKGQEHI